MIPLEVVLLVAFTLTPLIDPEQKVVPDEVEEQLYPAWETEVIPINPTNEILVANNSLSGFIVKKAITFFISSRNFNVIPKAKSINRH